MLKTRYGDLFAGLTEPCVIAHGCNAQGKMGKGFAYELRKRYPQAYLAYYAEHVKVPYEVGDLLFVKCGPGLHVANCITQKFYGNNRSIDYVDYDAVRRCLRNVARFARMGNQEVHLPLIGGGNAHGNVERLLQIFSETLDVVQATLWLKE